MSPSLRILFLERLVFAAAAPGALSRLFHHVRNMLSSSARGVASGNVRVSEAALIASHAAAFGALIRLFELGQLLRYEYETRCESPRCQGWFGLEKVALTISLGPLHHLAHFAFFLNAFRMI